MANRRFYSLEEITDIINEDHDVHECIFDGSDEELSEIEE